MTKSMKQHSAFTLATFDKLSEAIDKSYKKGIADVVKLNKQQKFKEKNSIISVDYTANDMTALKHFKLEAFTVAGVQSYELQEKLKDLAVEIWKKKGQSFKVFEEEARRIMLQYIPLEDQLPSGWMETNLKTAIGQSYSAAQYIRLTDPEVSDIYPAWQFMTRNDSHVREEHAALHAKVFSKDDPIWSSIYPPLDWNCRCYVIPIAASELDQYEVEGMKRSAEYQKTLLAGVNPDFVNAGEEKSIWGKWVKAKFKDLPAEMKSKINKDIKSFFKTVRESS